MITICVSEDKVDRQKDSWLAGKSCGHTLCPWPCAASLCWVWLHSGPLHPPNSPSYSGGGQALKSESKAIHSHIKEKYYILSCRYGKLSSITVLQKSGHTKYSFDLDSSTLLLTLPTVKAFLVYSIISYLPNISAKMLQYDLMQISESSNLAVTSLRELLRVTCSASSLLIAKASWSCRSSSPELCGQACSGSAPPECEPADRLPPRLGAEGAEEARKQTKKHTQEQPVALPLWRNAKKQNMFNIVLTTRGLCHLLFGFERVDPLLS